MGVREEEGKIVREKEDKSWMLDIGRDRDIKFFFNLINLGEIWLEISLRVGEIVE